MSRWIVPLLLLGACQAEEGDGRPPGDTGISSSPDTWMPPVDCDTWSSPGPDMLEGTVEAEQDFVARAASVDLSVVPDPVDLSGHSRFEVAVVRWMVGVARGNTLSHSDLEAAGPLGQAVLVASAAADGDGIDFLVLREGLQHTYHCSRPLPGSLDVLRTRYGDYEEWALEDLPCGAPKDERRRVWSHPDGQVVVAETMTAEGEVRETEVLFYDLRDDGQLDFAAYDEHGDLMDRSTFATVGAGPITFGAPYICISCHTGSDRVDVRRPDGLGAGCAD